MRNVMKEIAMNSIKDNEICIEDFGELILGDKCFIMPTKLNNVECYLKFFINPEIEAIKNEVKLLECLEDMQSPVMKLVKYKGKKIHYYKYNETIDVTFYISKKEYGDNNYMITYKLVNEIIKNIGMLHKNIKKIKQFSINLKTNTDYQNLVNFYVSNHQFCEEANLCNLLEEIIPIGVNEARVYPIHSDLYFNNFIIKDNEFKSFIDFSDIRKSYFEDDLGKFFQNLMCSQNYNIYQIEKLIEVYENITEDKMERINVYMSVIYRAIYREYCRVTKSGSKTFDKRTKEVIESLSLMMKKCKLKGM